MDASVAGSRVNALSRLNSSSPALPAKTSPVNDKAPSLARTDRAIDVSLEKSIPATLPNLDNTTTASAQSRMKAPVSAFPALPGKMDPSNKALPGAAEAAAALRTTPSSVAAGKRPLVAAKSAVPVVPSAPARSVTGSGITIPPAPPVPAAVATKRSATATPASTQVTAPLVSSSTTSLTSSGPAALSNAGGITSFASAASSEREKIRDFWLALSEVDRRGLVKIEKDTVLKKMKEQQRHGCTCAVCGRKRNAIEIELEVLYDAYYDELENYANHQQLYKTSAPGTIPPPIGPGPFPGSVDPEKFATPATVPSGNNAAGAGTKSAAMAGAKKPTASAQLQVKGRPAVTPATIPAGVPKATKTPASTVAAKEKHHTHSPSCPHYPHSHNHPHHHHHPAPAGAVQARGKAALTSPSTPDSAVAQHVHDDAIYSDEDEDYGDEEGDDEGEYDDDGK